MKITSSLTTIVSIGSVALAVALVACFTFTAVAQEKGATKLLPSKPGQSVSCEMPAMSCPKCKESLVITEGLSHYSLIQQMQDYS